jgi:hypothetical protein
MAVEVDTHARPVEAGCHLLDVGGLTRAVIARDHHAAVMGKAGENGERRLAIEEIVGVEVGHIGVALAVRRNADIGIDAKDFTDRDGRVGKLGNIKVNLAHHVSKAGDCHPAISNSAVFDP